MNELALFAGTGGGILGGHLLGWRCVCAVEKEPYAREVLLRRQRDGVLPLFPIWDDVRSFNGREWRGAVDVVSAGFPCQPFSVAGKRHAENDERNLWPETIRVIREVGPEFAFLENVPGLLSHDYFGQIIGGLAEAGYDATWDIVSAAETGAPHTRKRLWILAYTDGDVGGIQSIDTEQPDTSEPRDDGADGAMADANSRGLETERLGGILDGEREALGDNVDGRGEDVADSAMSRPQIGMVDSRRNFVTSSRVKSRSDWWEAEPAVGRVADGVAHRVDRIRATGNGQVPRVVVEAWNRLQHVRHIT